MSLTSCLKKAGSDLRTADKNAVLALSREYRTSGKTPIAAAIQAVEDQMKAVQALIDEAQKPKAEVKPEPKQDLLGDAPNASQQAAEDLRKAKEKKEQAQRDAAPLPADFGLGMVDSRNGNEVALGRGGLLDAPSNPDILRAQADLQNALADLGDIFGKNTRLTMMPEQEAKILPVLVKLFDAAFRMGYHSFKDAAKFALDKIRAALGAEIADDITLEHLQGAYISMSSGKKGIDNIRVVSGVEAKSEIEKHVAKADNQGQEKPNVPSPNVGVERDSDKPGVGPAVVPTVPNVAGGTAPRAGNAGGQASGGNGSGRQDGISVPAGGSLADRERGDQLVRGGREQAGPAGSDARTDFGERSGDSGITGIPPDAIPASEVKATATSGDDDLRKRSAQRAASQLAVKPGDLQNIRDTLPYLLPPQQEDVHKAETIFAKPTGYGMLFTNGTGTGKTFSGLGVVKRFAMRGKENTLIVVPDNKIASDWIKSGRALGLDITQLDDTTQAGKGIVLTTYANLGANDALAKRQWDLIVPDETHTLMQAADGVATSYLQNLRAITHHPDGAMQRYTMQNRADIDRFTAIDKEIIGNNKIINKDDTMDVMRSSLQAANEKLEKELAPLRIKLQKARDSVKEEVAAMQGAKRTRLVFLSATPFAYEKTVDWANGYLFDYMEGYPYDPQRAGLNYNQPDPFQYFMMTRFGYTMRFNKLNAPSAKVDSGLLQRQFNGELKKKGVLSGRMLDVKPDYDRRFVLVDSAIGNKIDEALEWLTDKASDESEAQAKIEDRSKRESGMAALRDAIKDQFDYLSRRYLLEAIKAESVIPIVKQHLALGRKVVVFHDYNKGGSTNPFAIQKRTASTITTDEIDAAKVINFNKALAQFNAKFPELVTGLNDLLSPIEVFKKQLPQTMLINGKEKEKDLLARYLSFQDDANGPQVMLVQSDKNKGWSGHDTTGKHQRVLINLGQPTAPTKAIQQEGRIYRTGQASNAIMRYLNTGTSWERWAFATTIAQRSSTAENLGMGEHARALKDAFIAAFEESDAYPPGHEGEGTGGKERDKAANDAITEYDRAKSFYWGTQKKNSKTKAQEGADYFATPEPVGLKMVEWLDARSGEDLLEPSGGHGAIARWMPEKTQKTVIEPSANLRSRMALVLDIKTDTNKSGATLIDGTFEELNVVNKFDGIAMNPPFGSGGKTAIDHLAKAATHLRDGGRIVALIPTGPAADKKFDKWFYESSEKAAKPIFTLGSEKLYRGDTLHFKGFGREFSMVLGRVAVANGTHYAIPEGGDLSGGINLGVGALSRIEHGPRTESYNPTADLMLVADIKLPQVTFERAGTAVATRIVVLEKHAKESDMPKRTAARMDFSNIDDINDLFDRLENVTLPGRPKVDPVELEVAPRGEKVGQSAQADKPAKPAKAEKKKTAVGDMVTLGGKQYPAEIYKTNAGKDKIGVWMDSKEEAQKFSKRTFTHSSKKGKWFVDEFWFPKDAKDDFDAPMAARGTVAREPQAAYSGTYETDLFGEPLSTDLFGGVVKTDGIASAKPTGSKLRGDAQPTGTLQDTPATPGEYFVNTLIGTETNREIGAKRVATPFQAATATQYLYKSAVERLDGIVTDVNHKPLAVIGGFKGAVAEVSVYPGTLMAEAIRIPGAAHIWFSHNHPSGKSELSRADMALNRTLSDVFTGSGIQPMGLMAVGDGKFSFVSGTIDTYGRTDGELFNEDIPQSTGTTKLPVIERTIGDGKPGPSFSDPAGARSVGKVFYDKTKQPGIMLLNAQSQVTAWIPITDQMRRTLRGTGGLNAIYRAISQSNPAAAVIIHGGELHRKTLPEGTPSQLVTASQNIAAALKNVGVQTLDSIDIVSGDSVASIGGHVAKGPVYSRSNPFYSALTKGIENIKANAAPGLGWLDAIKGLVNKGMVKADEVEWSGVTDWLKLQTGKVMKADVVAFLDANGVKVTETTLSGETWAVWDEKEQEESYFGSRDEARKYLKEIGGASEDMFLKTDAKGEAKYSNYQLPGGTNYREVLLTLPDKMRPVTLEEVNASRSKVSTLLPTLTSTEYDALVASGNVAMVKVDPAKRDYKSSHWDQPNILAHIRLNDRLDAEGKRVLFVEELQSDFAQDARKKGIKNDPESQRKFDALKAEFDGATPQRQGEISDEMNAISDANRDGVANAPFIGRTDAWVSLALKRVIKMAVDGGYDKVAFVNGEQSAARYDLSKQVRKLAYQKNTDGTFKLSVETDANGSQLVGEAIKADKIEDYAGKEIAKKIIDGEGKVESWMDGLGKRSNWSTLSGLDLKVGGEGMKAFYDKIVPSVAKDVIRKLGGGQMETVMLPSDGSRTYEELNRLSDVIAEQVYGKGTTYESLPAQSQAKVRELVKKRQISQPGFTITPAMKERAADGLPLFAKQSMGGMTIDQARAITDPLTSKWNLDVKVVDSPADLPVPAPSDVRGMYMSGKIWIVAGNNRNRKQILETLGHEAIAHHGLREMLGREDWRKLMANISLAIKSGNKPLNAISQRVRREYVDDNGKFNLNANQEADEIAAKVVEGAIDPVTGEFNPGFGFMKSVFAKVAQFLRDLGIDIKFTNLELQGMLVASMRNMESGARMQGGGAQVVAASRASGNPSLSRTGDLLTSYTPEEAKKKQLEEEAARKAEAEKPKAPPGRKVTADQVDLFNPQDSLFSRGTNDSMTNKDVVGNQGGRSADDTTPGTVKQLQNQLASIEAEYEPLRKRKAFGAEWSDVETRAGAVMNRLMELTGDPYGKKTVKAQRPSDDALNAEYLSPEDVPQDVRAWVQKYAGTLTSDATDAVRWGRIADTLKDDRYPSGDLTIYRAVADASEIRAGDWVTTERKYAEMHLRKYLNGKGEILEETVNGRDVLVSPTGNNEEAIYAPRSLSGPVANEPTAPDSGGAPMFARGPVNIWSAPPAGDSLIYEIQDQRVDLKRVLHAIEKSGQQIEEKWDARLAETIYPGRVAHRSQVFLETEAKPMLEAMAKAKISMDEMADYLHARGAEERNVQIAKVNPNMPDGGAGTNTQGTLMTTANAKAYLASINPARKAQLDAVAARVDAITKGTRRLLVAEGLEKQSAINNWEAVYKNYVPMFKDEAESAMPPHPQGTGFTVKGKASKRAMGSTKEVTNMLAHVLMQREAAITRAEKNRVALSLYGMALSHPNPDFWTTIKPGMSHGQVVQELQSMGVDVATAFVGMKAVPTIRVIDPVTNQVVDRANPVYKSLPGAITFKLNGEDRVIMLNVKHERGARLATSLKNLDGLTQLDIAGSIIGKSTRWLAAVNTQYNPAFGLVNLTRDVLGGVINLGSTELKGNALKVLAKTPIAILGIARELSSKGQSGKWQTLYRQFKADGAQTGWRENFRDPNERAKAIEKELADLKRAGKLSPGRFAHAMLDLLDGFNTTLENAVRLSAYSQALDRGISRPNAARLARELTVDFNRKGRMGREVGPLYAFFNASVQGSARTIETLKSPTGKAVIAGGLSLGVIQALMLLAAGYDDDELKEFEKTRTLIIPTNWTGEGKKSHIMIPYPLGLHVLPNTGRVLAELTLNGGKDIGKRSMEAIGEIAGAFNPLGGGNIFTADGALKTIAPTLVDPVIEIGFNRNFAGNPIERQGYGSETDNRPGFVRTKEATQRSTTGQVYMEISKVVNSMTGGTDYEAGTLSPTPERIRYIAQTAGGGVLREIEKTINATTATMRGEKTTRSQIPVLGRFAGEVDDDQVQTSRYFETSKKIHRLDSSLKAMTKAGDAEAAEKLVDANPEVLMTRQFNKTQQIIGKLNKEAVQTIGDVKEMEAIDQDRISLMRDLNEAMKEMEKDSGRVTLADRLKPVLKPKMAEAVP